MEDPLTGKKVCKVCGRPLGKPHDQPCPLGNFAGLLVKEEDCDA